MTGTETVRASWVSLALWTAVLEGLCFLAFVLLASTQWASVGKPAALLAVLVTAVASAWLGAGSHAPRDLVRYAAVVGCGNLVLLEALAYTVYPGLAKDMDFLSKEHAFRSVVVLVASFVSHLALAFAMRLMRRMAAFRTA